MAKQLYAASEAAAALGISLDTLRRWDKSGRIKVERDAAIGASFRPPRSSACAATAPVRISARAIDSTR